MKTIRKLLLLGIFFILFFTVIYVTIFFIGIYAFTSGCGTHDGPFEAVLIQPVEIQNSADTFELSNDSRLVLDDRDDALSPVLVFLVGNRLKWTLDMDLKIVNENYYISSISISDVSETKEEIILNFHADWNYGYERGWMTINKENGDNEFCLSW